MFTNNFINYGKTLLHNIYFDFNSKNSLINTIRLFPQK